MAIQTVLGEIKKEQVGLTLMHEHIFMDLRKKFEKTSLEQSDELVTKDKIQLLRQNHRLLKDNLFLADENLAREELALFRDLGGKTVVHMSNRGMGSNPHALQRISEALGIHIVECTGFYTAATHPAYMYDYTAEQMAELFEKDIFEGIDDTGIKAGIIGEIGTSAVVTDRELRVLEAAALAQKRTGAAISVHIDPWAENGMQVLQHLEQHHADLSRVIIDHVDAVINPAYCRELLKTGAAIEFENFGKNYQTPGLHFDTDQQRVETIAALIADGYENQILLSTDICLKTDLYCYGGGGYGHIPRTILPLMREYGISDSSIQAMTVGTPGRMLDK